MAKQQRPSLLSGMLASKGRAAANSRKTRRLAGDKGAKNLRSPLPAAQLTISTISGRSLPSRWS